jgi:hypothetical protein
MDAEDFQKRKRAEETIRKNSLKSIKALNKDIAKIRLMRQLGVMTVYEMDRRDRGKKKVKLH